MGRVYRQIPPPPIGGWDISGDTFLDISGTAIFLDDLSGTFTSDMFLTMYDQLTPVVNGTVIISAVGVKADTTQVNLGSATYAIGAALSAPTSRDGTWSSWTNGGGNGLDDYLCGLVAAGGSFNFAKRLFAENESTGGFRFINSDSTNIYFKVEVKDYFQFSINTESDRMLMNMECTDFGMSQPVVARVLNSDMLVVLCGATESSPSRKRNFHLIDGGSGGTECYSTDYFRSAVNSIGVSDAVIDHNNPDDTEPTIYYGGRIPFAARIVGYDIDGFPMYSGATSLTTTLIAGTGSIHVDKYPMYINDMPVLMYGTTQGRNAFKCVANTAGTYNSPEYEILFTSTLSPSTDPWYLIRALDVKVDSSARVYIIHQTVPNAFVNGDRQFVIMDFTGSTFSDTTHWRRTQVVAGQPVHTLPDSGTGDVASIGNFPSGSTGGQSRIVLDENDMFFGYPTIYLGQTNYHVIQRIRHNGGVSGTPADWQVDVILGQVGVAGSDEGVGTACTFNSPRGLQVIGKTLYICDTLNQKIRAVDIDSASGSFLQTSTYLVDGVGSGTGDQNSIEY